MKPKAITYKSDDNNTPISKEIYDKILEERMVEIIEMSDKIDYSKLIYDFKRSTAPVDFAKLEGPIYIYDEMKDAKATLQQVEKQQKDFKKELS